VFLPIDPSSGLPVYRQIMDQVRRMVVAGRLRPGERLPSIRELAIALQLNPLTVGKAYGGLERARVVEMRRGLGMFVLPLPDSRESTAAVPSGVEQAARRVVLEAAQARLTRARTFDVIDDAWRELGTKERKKS
jgi:GntR family transcriptional regulator